MDIDFGTVSLIVNIAALVLVTIGVIGRRGAKKALHRHGYLSMFGFVLKMVTVFAVMIPVLIDAAPEIAEFAVLPLTIVILKVVLGVAGDVMGFVCIVPWFLKPLDQMNCRRVKRWMLPTFVIWTVSIVLGIIVHLGEIL